MKAATSKSAKHPVGNGRPKQRDPLQIFRRMPKLPSGRQRRLRQLLDKGGERSLTIKEMRELQTILNDVDRRSFWRLAELVANQAKLGPRRVVS